VREAEEREGLRRTLVSLLSMLGGMHAELDEPRLFGMQFQAELLHAPS
jgi:hypothetical protein